MMPFKSLRCGTPVEVEDQSFDGQPPNLGVEPTAQIAAAQAARSADARAAIAGRRERRGVAQMDLTPPAPRPDPGDGGGGGRA